MKKEMKKEESKQAVSDSGFVKVLQDKNSTQREKERAFNELYSTHQRQVLIYFLKMNKDSEIAEDLRMITFQKVHENIERYDTTKGAFSTWLYKIAQNTFIDNKRKDKFEVLSLDALSEKTNDENSGYDAFQITDNSLNPEQGMVRDEMIKEVSDVIESVDNKLIRELMKHRFLDELSFSDIAKKMGIEDNSTLRVNILRGKEILREKIVR